MKTSFPIWDRTGTFILLNDDGKEIWLEEHEVRAAIGKQQIGVMRPHGSARDQMKLYLKVSEEKVFPKGTRRIQSAQPACVRVTVGDIHRVYMHVAERCQAHYDGREMPVVKYNHYAKPGTPHTRGSYKIDRQYL
jgi:hypothetical protein